MIKRTHILILILLVSVLSGCITQDSSEVKSVSSNLKATGPVRITRTELSDRIQKERDFLLIDVRTEAEYMEGHLPGAIVIPYNEFDKRYKEILDYKEKEVVLYCHVGGMGEFAGKVLLKNGFSDVRNLEGGITGWIRSGGRLES